MQPLCKIAAALFLGLLAGGIVGQFPPRHSPRHDSKPQNIAPHAFAAVPLTDWQSWLDDSVPLTAPADISAFWQGIAADQRLPAARQQLNRDEAYVLLPDVAFTAILRDPRFIALNPEKTGPFSTDDQSQWKPAWWLRLWQSGPANAIQVAGTLPSPFLNDKLERYLIQDLARTDPDTGLAWIQTLDDPFNPLADYLGAVAAHDLEKAQELWTRLPSQGPTKWSRTTAAFARKTAASALVREWAKSDWQSAMAWTVNHLSPEDAQQTMGDMLRFMGAEKSRQVLEAAAGIKDSAIRSLAYSHTLSAEGGGTIETLMDKALALPENALDQAGWGLLGQRSAGMVPRTADPAAQAAKLRSMTERVPEAHRQEFIKQAAIMAGWNNKPLAGQLLEYLPDGNAGMMAGDWVEQDPMAASSWLAALPDSPKRDAAVAGFCRGLAPLDPKSAAEWALTVQDAKLKAFALQDAVGAWKQKDPEAVRSWLDGAGLDRAPFQVDSP